MASSREMTASNSDDDNFRSPAALPRFADAAFSQGAVGFEGALSSFSRCKNQSEREREQRGDRRGNASKKFRPFRFFLHLHPTSSVFPYLFKKQKKQPSARRSPLEASASSRARTREKRKKSSEKKRTIS